MNISTTDLGMWVSLLYEYYNTALWLLVPIIYDCEYYYFINMSTNASWIWVPLFYEYEYHCFMSISTTALWVLVPLLYEYEYLYLHYSGNLDIITFSMIIHFLVLVGFSYSTVY